MRSIPDLTLAFKDQLTVDTSYGACTLRLFSPGSLILTSGKILACDPLAFWQHEPFVRQLLPGTYPVFLTVLRRQQSGDERVAFARLQLIPDVIPNRWELATVAGQDITILQDDEFFGYGVDTGNGCFTDVTGIEQWEQIVELQYKDMGRHYVKGVLQPRNDPIFQQIDDHYVHTWSWGNFDLDTAPKVNVTIFSSGAGDSTYPSYWGFDENDHPVSLVTDFMILRESSRAE